MQSEMQSQVKVLKESVARKIAAGEVIDRPNSIVRELMDNAIDAGSTRLDLTLEGGGIDRIRLVDNGRGMSRDDLTLCCMPHATSKIETEDDLMTIKSLGFRGEALSSIAASSRLEIISTRNDETSKLSIQDGRLTDPVPWRGDRGTIVDARDLFYSIPARRKFLKRPASEGTLCRKTFLEKALPFPEIHFQLINNGKIRDVLPPSSLKERVVAAYGDACPAGMMEERKTFMDGAEITIVAARPEWNRNDRRYMQVFANNRRIDEYAFVQAMQYGYDEILPGGVFPLCFAFLQVDPALVDFNIHPAKREARFRNKGALHHELVSLIKDFLREFSHTFPGMTLPDAEPQELGMGFEPRQSGSAAAAGPAAAKERINWQPPSGGQFPGGNNSSGRRQSGHQSYPATPEAQTRRFTELVKETPPLRSHLHPDNGTAPMAPPQEAISGSIRYMGQIMGVFLLAEIEDALYILDQHAAHEKLLYNRYRSEIPARQDLLIPFEFEAGEEEIRFMEAHRKLFEDLGIAFGPGTEEGIWEITALPRAALSMEEDIVDFLRCRKGSPAELQKELYATMSCRNAIKEGDSIDPGAALKLLKGALALENPRCPHGRIMWFRLSRDELYGLVGRLV
ncbi:MULTISPECIES: DNA mismatch repair endonuclease MutL [unclassified Oceanispirochaeta]|uniref:DNA mismatch repair endonuclease MutL n=1 Tax=unclassified Oceanispirochaeta TaxID=2635722 RepID=UPI000E09475C|nr:MULTISPECIES: DNA mismatch repair endonuclease MutL [unclassified Oceanispirochaeta]MBF9018315.1 DNA mismatch repair endonuclease MutL [Oceanispirochaeta sp. M2]NPD74780.1 DNA mismatch repair endonuclease MutL [Oceanispirochaeta sp. M1]RDG29392.1 DNA mismatch repair endonuclease MutL [Oceanispirochaeta sp. M1]